MSARTYDLVIYGATGFVGSRLVAYLAQHPDRRRLRWAIGGRHAARLEALRAGLGDRGKEIGTCVADSGDSAALNALAGSTRVLLNAAGPYSLYGNGVVDACVRQRTHYADITGETVWVRALIDRHHATAAADGTRVVPCCGFDSVPSDLGVYLLVRHLQRKYGEPCAQVVAYYQMYGGFNGGTVASNLHRHESGQIVTGRDPFLLDPPGRHDMHEIESNRDPEGVHHDPAIDTWVGPFIMGAINTRVVRRSAALHASWGEPYGAAFRYQEYTKFDAPLARVKATLVTSAVNAYEAAMDRPHARAWLKRWLPAPGSGPSEKTMAEGWFTNELIGCTESGQQARLKISFRGDPSNRATLRFLCEGGLSLALDGDRLPGAPHRGGVLTPSTAFGDVWLERLRAAGFRFEFEA